VGNLMGALVGGSMMIEGYIARLMYTSLYKTHELALHGYTKVALDTRHGSSPGALSRMSNCIER